MSYIGRAPTDTGEFRLIDEISSSFDGSTQSFDLKVGTLAITPTKENIIIALDGVLQDPSSAYTVSGSTIKFSEGPVSDTTFYGVLTGQVGASIANSTITNDHVSGTAAIDQSKLNLSVGIVSASAQLATDISGSLGTNAALIRSLTAVGVSGSLGTNATLIRGLTTGKISGSLGTNATLIRSLTAAGISGSVVAGVSGSAVSTGSFGKLEVGGNSTLTGKLTVGGRITAQEFHTEFVSSSIVFQSGSTKFGDSATDTHTFTGQLEVSGSQAKVSASVGSTGSFGSIYVDKNVNASAFVGDGSSLTGIDIPTAAAISGSIVGGVSGSSTSTGSFGSVYTRGVGSSSFHTILPAADDTYDLGSAALQWKDIYTGDFHLNNTSREEGNVIDGTKGNWTIQEGREDLYLLNNETGKKYKFNLTEIE